LTRIPAVFAAAGLAACLFEGGERPPGPGANYLAPGSSPLSCTEFTQYDTEGGVERPSRWFQVFMWTDSSGRVGVGEEIYNRLATEEAYLGALEFSLDPRVPSQAESLSFFSSLHIVYNDRYRDLAEVRSLALERIPLDGLIPPDNANRIGYAAPFRYGSLDLDTAWIIINGDNDDSGSGYGMVFRKNGETALTYRFSTDTAAGDSLLWVIRETRRPCGPIHFAPKGWLEQGLKFPGSP
jgi:hypothetical protein